MGPPSQPGNNARCPKLDVGARAWAGAAAAAGGESTALLRLMDGAPWLDALRAFHAEGGALLGTCAGAILLAREVQPPQPSLGLLDAIVERNAYGRQTESFEAELDAPTFAAPVRGVFIRASRLTATGPDVEGATTPTPTVANWPAARTMIAVSPVRAASIRPSGETRATSLLFVV